MEDLEIKEISWEEIKALPVLTKQEFETIIEKLEKRVKEREDMIAIHQTYQGGEGIVILETIEGLAFLRLRKSRDGKETLFILPKKE